MSSEDGLRTTRRTAMRTAAAGLAGVGGLTAGASSVAADDPDVRLYEQLIEFPYNDYQGVHSLAIEYQGTTPTASSFYDYEHTFRVVGTGYWREDPDRTSGDPEILPMKVTSTSHHWHGMFVDASDASGQSLSDVDDEAVLSAYPASDPGPDLDDNFDGLVGYITDETVSRVAGKLAKEAPIIGHVMTAGDILNAVQGEEDPENPNKVDNDDRVEFEWDVRRTTREKTAHAYEFQIYTEGEQDVEFTVGSGCRANSTYETDLDTLAEPTTYEYSGIQGIEQQVEYDSWELDY